MVCTGVSMKYIHNGHLLLMIMLRCLWQRVFQWNGFLRIGKMNHRTMKVNDYSFKSENEPFHLAVNHI